MISFLAILFLPSVHSTKYAPQGISLTSIIGFNEVGFVVLINDPARVRIAIETLL